MPDSPANNLERLITAGIDRHDAVDFVIQAARSYDKSRRLTGMRNGALGHIGCDIYRHFASGEDSKDTDDAFSSYRFCSLNDLAETLGYSSSSTGSGLRRLFEHGFAHRRSEGKGYRLRLLAPEIALKEFANEVTHGEASQNSMAFENYRHLGKTVLALYQ